MGFFKDFKRDFAQAVNELMPDKDEVGAEYDDEDMVNTFDEDDRMDEESENMLENLDEIRVDESNESEVDEFVTEPQETLETQENQATEEAASTVFDIVPEAEIIGDGSEQESEPFSESELEPKSETEYLQAEPEKAELSGDGVQGTEDDELKADDALDEEDMLEHVEEALMTEPDTEQKESFSEDILKADLEKAVEDTMARQEEKTENGNREESVKEGDASLNTVEEQAAKKTDNQPLFEADTTYITKSTTINGDIETDGCIDLIGTVNGSVSCDGKLIIGGTIKGNVKAGEIYANAARIEGEVRVAESAKIGVGTVVVGDIYASSAVVAGAVKGDIDVQGPVIVDSTAVIMGNIKSKSVQINNGAVIEGMCSQCYSEIDVKSFFE